MFDNFIPMRGISGGEPGMLNKTMGCDSPTVPPLYALMDLFDDESRSLGNREGRKDPLGTTARQAISQKTYASDFSCSLRVMGSALSRKNGRGAFVRRGLTLFSGGFIMKNKKLILAAVALVAIVALMLGVWFATRPEAQQGAKTYTVTVVHSDGTEKTFTYHTDEERLEPALLAEGLIAGEEGAYGLTVITVDGEDAVWDADSAYWCLYIGEEYATTGVRDTYVYDGSSFKLVYTTYSES